MGALSTKWRERLLYTFIPSQDILAAVALTIAIIHSFHSACTCHLAVEDTCRRFGYTCFRLDAEHLPDALPPCDLVFELSVGYKMFADWRWYPRQWALQQGVPVVGSAPSVVRLCDNKALTKQVLQQCGAPVPRGLLIPQPQSEPQLREALSRAGLHSFPLVVKPVVEHGSTGLSLVRHPEELEPALTKAIEATAGPALVEEYIDGIEVEYNLLESWRGSPLPIMELAGLSGVYDAAAKSSRSGAIKRRAAQLPAAVEQTLRAHGVAAAAALGCSSFMRFDIRIAGGVPYFLEANAKPTLERGFGVDAAMSELGGDVTDVVQHLIEVTLEAPKQHQITKPNKLSPPRTPCPPWSKKGLVFKRGITRRRIL